MDLFSIGTWLVKQFSGTWATGDNASWDAPGRRGTAGIEVTSKTALNSAHVFACVRAIAETEASLPLPCYTYLPDGGKERERDHPCDKLLNVSPDGVINAMQWREANMAHVLTRGNSYNEIEFYKDFTPKAIHLLDPSKITPKRTKAGTIEYALQGQAATIPAEYMLHFAGIGYDGLVGYSPVRLAARSIGLGMAAEAFGSAFYEHGSKPGGVVINKKKMSEQAKKNLREGLENTHGGPERFGKWAIVEEDMQFQTFEIPPNDAQFLETRLFQLQEICRWYRIDPGMVQEHSHSTFTNVEQQSINFVVHTMRPWCERLECEINRKLFPVDDNYFAEHKLDGLLRGDMATRYAAYAIARQWGWFSVDDIRELENMNPLPDDQGKIYLTPANMADVSKVGQTDPASTPANPQPAPAQEPKAEASAEAVSASLACVQDNIDRMLRREAEFARNAARKPKEFLRSVEEFYRGHSDIVTKATAPSLHAFSALVGKSCEFSTVEQLLGGEKELLELSGKVTADQLPAAVEQWINQRSSKSAAIIGALAL